MRQYLEREYGARCRDRYWAIQERLFADLGYRDYLGAVQQYRVEYPDDMNVLSMSVVFPRLPLRRSPLPRGARGACPVARLGADRYPHRRRRRVPAAQSRALRDLGSGGERAVLIYVHKEESLEDVERRYPARHYVLVDDKLRILAAVKTSLG